MRVSLHGICKARLKAIGVRGKGEKGESWKREKRVKWEGENCKRGNGGKRGRGKRGIMGGMFDISGCKVTYFS